MIGAAMKTQREIEAAVCDGVSRFEQEYMGRGPRDIRAHLLGDLLVVRLQGVLTAAEQHLVRTVDELRASGHIDLGVSDPTPPGSDALTGKPHRR